jgi:hypothetical protein
MHRKPSSESDMATPRGGFDPGGSKRDNPRRVLHRTARKHGMAPKHLSALIAHSHQLARRDQR